MEPKPFKSFKEWNLTKKVMFTVWLWRFGMWWKKPNRIMNSIPIQTSSLFLRFVDRCDLPWQKKGCLEGTQTSYPRQLATRPQRIGLQLLAGLDEACWSTTKVLSSITQHTAHPPKRWFIDCLWYLKRLHWITTKKLFFGGRRILQDLPVFPGRNSGKFFLVAMRRNLIQECWWCPCVEQVCRGSRVFVNFQATNTSAIVTDESLGAVLHYCGPWNVLHKNLVKLATSPWFFGSQTSEKSVAMFLTGTDFLAWTSTNALTKVNHLALI